MSVYIIERRNMNNGKKFWVCRNCQFLADGIKFIHQGP